MKDSQGEENVTTIPPLLSGDRNTVFSNRDKVDLLAQHFSRKMTVAEPTRPPPTLPGVAGDKLTSLTTIEEEIRAALSPLDETKAVGPDGVSPRVLRRCSGELAAPLIKLFVAILRNNRWPRIWKTSHIIPER